jgi:hypothetical protein
LKNYLRILGLNEKSVAKVVKKVEKTCVNLFLIRKSQQKIGMKNWLEPYRDLARAVGRFGSSQKDLWLEPPNSLYFDT